ncbi:hypothetical protein [Streptomyces sp. CBMA123]|uniref:hypothetical protein n=1 Tax=Streptomyces sp. CBMA123 TaxID=1896313 RepID=UPI001661D55C|nr:hypothetical protein [Streptomyces sp. CBMA123]MBD0689539.1 hypothetical protein [Streptomyces sp. CBMA123]
MAERSRRRVLPVALGAAVLAAGVGGGAWWWRSAQSADVPTDACWNAFTHDDLAELSGEGHQAVVWQGTEQLDSRNALADPVCAVDWKGDDARTHWVAKIEVALADERFLRTKTDAENVGWAPVRPARLEFGSGAQGWLFHDGTVQLVVRCDSPAAPASPAAREKSGTAPPPYRKITITGDRGAAETPAARVHQIRVDAALRTARELVRAQGCANAPQLAGQSPTAPF